MDIRQLQKKLLIRGLESMPLVNYEPAALKEWATGWQIEYRILNPNTGLLEKKRLRFEKIRKRIRNDVKARKYAKLYCDAINEKLESGWNPYTEGKNVKAFHKLTEAFTAYINEKTISVIKVRDYEEQGLKIDTTLLDDYFKKHKSFAPLYLVSLKVENVYKGENVSDTITIITPIQGRTCGYQYFETGISMIIYGTYKFPLLGVMSISSTFPMPISELPANHYWTNHCTRTTYWYKEEEDNILKALQTQG